EPAAGKRRLLPAPTLERDFELAVLERQPERIVGVERREQIAAVVASGEVDAEYDLAPVHVEDAARAVVALLPDARLAEAADLDVDAGEERLERSEEHTSELQS